MIPIAGAADLVCRYLDRHGRRHTFRPQDDVEPFIRWLRATDLTGEWRRCRGLAGQITDGGLLDAVAYEHPELVALDHPRGDPDRMPQDRSLPRESAPDRRSAVLPDYQPGAALVRDPATPTQGELCRVRLVGLNLVGAVLRDDLATVYQLSPRSASDGGFLAVALAELAAELIAATGRDPAEVVDELRGATIRQQATGGRP